MTNIDSSEKPRRVPMIPGPRPAPTKGHHEVGPDGHSAVWVGPERSFAPAPVANLAKAIAGVMREVGTIEQRGVNRFHNYKYMLMGDLLFAVTPLMGKYGIAVFQDEIDIKTIEDKRVAVKYEFTVAHESGETRAVHQTGMANARDGKGNWDDKAINKAHTAARKYFLLSLFQAPAGDFDDADADASGDKPAPQRGPVPGPGVKQMTPEEHREAQVEAPHKISLGKGAGAEGWSVEYLKAIGKATTREEVVEWDKLNDETLQKIHDGYPDVYERMRVAVERRIDDLAPGMPDPKQDAQESMNWIATQLATLKTLAAVEMFWNQVVAPREKDFDTTDWEMLLREFDRAEARVGPPHEDDNEEATT